MNIFRRRKPVPNAVDFRRLQEINAAIDREYDAALEAAQTPEQAYEVERQRTQAHAAVGQAVLSVALDGWR